jgi:predicted transcriptional regulator
MREAKIMKIGEVAQLAGVGVETVRFYERQATECSIAVALE